MNNNLRLPAEWQNHSAVLLSWPHSGQDWAYMLDEVTTCYLSLAEAISKHARLLIVTPEPTAVESLLCQRVPKNRYKLVEMPTNDTWARDFGMICTTDGQGHWDAIDYKFNGWGLKFPACHDNLITRRLITSRVIDLHRCEYVNRLDFVLEGGSIDIDPDGVVLTTEECLLSPNRNGATDAIDIQKKLLGDFGGKKMIWLRHGGLQGDDTDSHVDTLARFLPGGQIAYSSCDREDDEHYGELKLMEAELQSATDIDGAPYTLVPLPIPSPIYDEDGYRLPATYANFLIVNGAVFMPVYGDEHYDSIAVKKIKAALPLYEVVTVDCRALICQHGSLHCVTMQIPDEIVDFN